MSGRSAYVRKEKTKVKDGESIAHEEPGKGSVPKFPNSPIGGLPSPTSNERPGRSEQHLPYRTISNQKFSAAKSIASSESDERHRVYDDLAYARARKPQLPVLDGSGIEKSSFRSLMDKKSENVRKGLARTFIGMKKKNGEVQEIRSPTSATVRPESRGIDSEVYEQSPPPPLVRPEMLQHQSFEEVQESRRPGPPQTALPPIPPRQFKRWLGSGRPSQPWNKLRKDPELWDPNGDTLVHFGHENQQPRAPPSFRLSSHILEATESRFLVTLLREGATDDMNSFYMPISPVSSVGMRPAQAVGRFQRAMPTPPMSEKSMGTYDGQISYVMYFPTPPHLAKSDSLRYQVTTRNVFAILYHASLVGVNLFQALNDLHERLESWMPSDSDNASLIIEYIVSRGIDDLRNEPATAAALLAWSETQGVRWEEGWREAYVHCAGMYSKLEKIPDYRFITPVSRALLERASLDIQVRVQAAEERLVDFDFEDMWPMTSSQPSPTRASFERLRNFLFQHYEHTYGSWPPANLLPPLGDDQWPTRGIAQRLQKDFGALYNYLVNREIVWDCSEEQSGRKWNISHPTNKSFDADTPDLAFTDILVAFDNRHKYPHIPHPYPLVPESIPVRSTPRENHFKAIRKSAPKEDKIAERRAALAYTEATNIYILGSDFVTNDLVDAFVRFEKTDKPGEVDPHAARRGRWILIYGILQTLATVAVDTPNLRYSNDVSYHLSPRLTGTPPWKGAIQNNEEADHEHSYCWTVTRTWSDGCISSEPPAPLKKQPTGLSVRSKTSTYMSNRSSTVPSLTESDTGSERWNSSRQGRRSTGPTERKGSGGKYLGGFGAMMSSTGYAPGVEKVDEWPLREESMRRAIDREAQREHGDGNVLIRDFDDLDEYEF